MHVVSGQWSRWSTKHNTALHCSSCSFSSTEMLYETVLRKFTTDLRNRLPVGGGCVYVLQMFFSRPPKL